MNVRNPAMPHGNNIFQKIIHAFCIIGTYRRTCKMHIIDCHNRNVTAHKFLNILFLKISTHNYNTIKIAVLAVLQIGHLSSGRVRIDKGNIISKCLCLIFDSVQYPRKILMCQSHRCFICVQYANILRPVRLKCSGCCIREISHLCRRFLNACSCLTADVFLIMQCLTYRCR